MARALAASIQVRRSLARPLAPAIRPPYCRRNATVRVLAEPHSRSPAGLTRSAALQPEQSSARARAIPFAARLERNARIPRRSLPVRRMHRDASIRHRPRLVLRGSVVLLAHVFVTEPPAPAVAATVTPARPTQLRPTRSAERRELHAWAVPAARPVKADSADVPPGRRHAETRASTCRPTTTIVAAAERSVRRLHLQRRPAH